MFHYLAALLVYALLTFGAVQPPQWILLTTLLLLGLALVAAVRISKGASATPELVALAIGGAIVLFLGPKPASAILAGGWAWAASGRGLKPVMKFLNVLIVVGVLEAFLGFIQLLVLPGWIFGYIGPNRVSGTLINRNHFAGLLTLLIPSSLGLLYVGVRRYGDVAKSYVYMFAAAFMAISLVFSLARAGVFSLLMMLLLLGILVKRKDATRNLATGVGLGMISLIFAGALWIGIDVVVERYAKLLEEDVVLHDGRLIVFGDTARMIEDHPFGVGYANYGDAFRVYQTYRPDLLFDHAHNDYLEIAAELGVPVATVFWTFLVAVLIAMIKAFLRMDSPEHAGVLLACIGAVTSMLIHSFTDFNLQIPSNAMLFFIFIGIGLRIIRIDHRSSSMKVESRPKLIAKLA
jgi:putative inorganic carbon (HCO3(-)) transporter